MLYSSVGTRVPSATAALMIGLIVACCTLASMRSATWPPRWISPRVGSLSFSSVPRPPLPFQRLRHWNLGQLRPARLPACGTVRAAPLCHSRRLALVPSHDVNFVAFHLALQFHRRRSGGQAAAQLLRHGLRSRSAQAQLQSHLPIGEIQSHEVEAQHPHPQRLVVPGQHHRAAIPRREMPRSGIKAGQVVETPGARLALISLLTGLRVVASVLDDDAAVTHGAADTFRPAVLAHQREAFGVVDQARKVDQVGCRHDKSFSREQVSYSRSCSRTRRPQPYFPIPAPTPRNPIRATPQTPTERLTAGRKSNAGRAPNPPGNRQRSGRSDRSSSSLYRGCWPSLSRWAGRRERR